MKDTTAKLRCANKIYVLVKRTHLELTDLGMCAATDTGRAVYDFSEASGRRDSLPSASSSSSSLSSEEDLFFGPQRAPSSKIKMQ